jgi:hypothetical protein
MRFARELPDMPDIQQNIPVRVMPGYADKGTNVLCRDAQLFFKLSAQGLLY